jgi:aminoglycoside phosphotransferase (APT) family kinase protein
MFDSRLVRSHPTEDWIGQMRARYPTEPTVDEALTRRLHKRNLGISYSSPTLQDVEQRLTAFLAANVQGRFTIRNLQRLTGGASKEQFVFDLDWVRDGERRVADRMVLRCEPAASIVETSRRREFELMQFGGSLMPVPTVYWLDEDGSQLGAPSLISGFVKGTQKPARVSSNVTGMGIHFPADYRAALGPQYVRYMVALHRAEIPADALPSFVRPAIGTTEAADLIVNWWARIWAEDLYEEAMIATITEHWLRRNAPVLDHVSVVHGDFRTGNFLFDEDSRSITAVLDWELGYVGDRHGDLAWVITDLYVTREGGRPYHCGLFAGTDDLIEQYEAAGGLAINRKKLIWHKIFCTWKQFVLSLGCALRAGDGRTHQDVLLTWLSGGGYILSESLRRLLEENA